MLFKLDDLKKKKSSKQCLEEGAEAGAQHIFGSLSGQCLSQCHTQFGELYSLRSSSFSKMGQQMLESERKKMDRAEEA